MTVCDTSLTVETTNNFWVRVPVEPCETAKRNERQTSWQRGHFLLASKAACPWLSGGFRSKGLGFSGVFRGVYLLSVLDILYCMWNYANREIHLNSELQLPSKIDPLFLLPFSLLLERPTNNQHFPSSWKSGIRSCQRMPGASAGLHR